VSEPVVIQQNITFCHRSVAHCMSYKFCARIVMVVLLVVGSFETLY
jgi:hypothetical protein